MNKRITAILVILTVLTIVFYGCRTPSGRTAGEVVDDSTIGTKVKAKLMHDDFLEGFSIDVDVFEGEVTMTGAVDTMQQKEKASEPARSVYGVKGVNNLLKIKQ